MERVLVGGGSPFMRIRGAVRISDRDICYVRVAIEIGQWNECDLIRRDFRNAIYALQHIELRGA